MDPDFVMEGQEADVTITGRNFFADVHISYTDKKDSYIRTDFTARLGDVELLDVSYVDASTLTARVPAGLAPGSHDLEVTGPGGLSGSLADAFTVYAASEDSDGDGVPDDRDRCQGHDDREDADGDGTPDGCDVCPGHDDAVDTDGDVVPDGCDICPGHDDSVDSDGDGVPDGCDVCPGDDDSTDTDGDGVPDGCDICPGHDDSVDTDNDGVPDGCDVCPGHDDSVDSDGDGVPDGCDICPGGDDSIDADGDGVADGCDMCPGFDDSVDADNDGVPDGCDVCAGHDDSVDSDGDFVPDGCDICAGHDDSVDTDVDGVPDGCDVCPGGDDTADADGDGVPDGCDICAGHDDSIDSDSDGVPDGCDICSGYDDAVDADGDFVPDGCDVCAGHDDAVDTDGDGVPDGCDVCAGHDDAVDTDGDGVPDGCDLCPGHDDAADADGDGVPDGCDLCPGFDDSADGDGDGIPDGCDPCYNGYTDPPWWNMDYAYRRPLLIEETAAGTLPGAYSVVAYLATDADVSQGDMLASGDDLRVVQHGAAADQELDRRLLGFDSALTAVWFKTTGDIDGVDGSYFLYYGNPSAGAPPDHWSDSMGAAATPSGVYLAADDFEDDALDSMPDGWEGSSLYKVEQDGANHVLAVHGTDGPADYLFAGDYAWTDVVLSARFSTSTTAATYNGLWMRAEGDSDFDVLFFGPADNNTFQAYHCTVSSPSATGLSDGNMIEEWNVSPDIGTAWHDFEVRMEGQDIAFFYDGSQLGSITLDPDDIPQGRVGCCSGYDATHLRFDDFVVRKYVDPEPTVTVEAVEPQCQ